MSILSTYTENQKKISPDDLETLTHQVITGDQVLLQEAVDLLGHDEKNMRTYAAQIIDQVALTYPQRVAPFLPALLPALNVPETQTRRMVLHTLGVCAPFETAVSLTALPKAQQIIRAQSGVTLWNATIIYLGYVGAVSAESARQVLPTLEQALRELPNLTKAILESYANLLDVADQMTLVRIAQDAGRYVQSSESGVRAIANKIVHRVAESGVEESSIRPGLDLHHATLIRDTQPEDVYEALTDPKLLVKWFTTNALVETFPGGKVHFRWENWGPDHITKEDSGPVLEAHHPDRFVFQWHPDNPEYLTTVEINIQLAGNGTIVRLQESGFEDTPSGHAALAKSAVSWGEALTLLKFYIEFDLRY